MRELLMLCHTLLLVFAGAFDACRGVTYWDQPLMLYLLPFMMVEAAGQGADGLQMVAHEIQAVMRVRKHLSINPCAPCVALSVVTRFAAVCACAVEANKLCGTTCMLMLCCAAVCCQRAQCPGPWRVCARH